MFLFDIIYRDRGATLSFCFLFSIIGFCNLFVMYGIGVIFFVYYVWCSLSFMDVCGLTVLIKFGKISATIPSNPFSVFSSLLSFWDANYMFVTLLDYVP